MSDRRLDLVITGGVNIYPAEIEAVLVQHPQIVDAVVFGTHNDEWGQEVTAVVELREGTGDDTTVDDIAELAASHLPSFKRPRRIVIEPSLPRFSFGKIDRRRLRDKYSS